MSDRIHDFKELLDSINTPGGHIFISLFVGFSGVVIGALLTWLAWPDVKLVAAYAGFTGSMTGFFQIAAYAMQGRDKANGKTIIVTSDSTEHREEIKSDKPPLGESK